MATSIIFKTSTPDAPGWEQRMLGNAFTDVLAVETDYGNHAVPTSGDRLREYESLDDGGAATHGRDGDWVIVRVQQFSDDDGSGDRVVMCYCEFQPVSPEWQELRRGAPASEMMEAATV